MQNCIEALEGLANKSLLNGIGDLIEDKMKTFVRNKLRKETITLLRLYKDFPIF